MIFLEGGLFFRTLVVIPLDPSKSDEPLRAMLGQSSSNESPAIKCYNPAQFLSRPCVSWLSILVVGGVVE